MQMIAVSQNGTEAAACAKSLARDGAQQPVAVLANENPDEALWAAYRRCDKAEELLCRHLHQRRNNGQRMGGARYG